MSPTRNYTILNRIDRTATVHTFLARSADNVDTVILKRIDKTNQAPLDLARFSHSYRTLRELDIDGIVKVKDIFEHESYIFIALEDFPGVPLAQLIDTDDLTLSTFLTYAVQISETLGRLHDNNIIHGNLNPHSVLVDVDNGKVKLTNFGFSDSLLNTPKLYRDPDFIRRTLSYISPEQTGRMNRSVDYRTDFYSFGILFYEVIAKGVPFFSKEPFELVYSHIAREPTPLSQKVAWTPQVVSDMVMKLLAKTAEERYQSAIGLTYDLSNCSKLLQSGDRIEPFSIASRDVSIHFTAPNLLFGRGKELRLLTDCYERVRTGTRQFVLVSGNPGVGKSSLVQEIRKTVVSSRGYFVSGKYDPNRIDVPYSAVIQAFQSLFGQILTETGENIRMWRERLLEALGPIGRVITDVIPELKLIIGTQPEVTSIGLEESKNRFLLAMRNFISALSSPRHPLVLFLDDLQWADSASLDLIYSICVDREIKYLFLIVTYRDTELHDGTLLAKTIEKTERDDGPIERVELSPLSESDVCLLVSNALKCDREKILPLSTILHGKTGGNPFFINQFLQTIHDNKMLENDLSSGWKWDLEAINKMAMADNVVDLLIGKINRLPLNAQKVLQACSCIGVAFELETLQVITEETVDTLIEDINILVRERLISVQENLHKFSHDRIHEAAYSMLGKTERETYHHTIGRHLLTKSSDSDLQDRILDIVNQLNQVIPRLTAPQREELAGLNLTAAQKAKASAAHNSAFLYCQTGINLIGTNGWKDHYHLTHSLHIEAAEAAYICTEYEKLENLYTTVLEHAHGLMDEIKIHEINIQMLMAQNKVGDAVDTGLVLLRRLGLRFPQKPHVFHVAFELMRTKLSLLGKRPQDLLHLPPMTSERMLAALPIINRLSTAAYWSNPNLLAILIMRTTRLTLKHGLCAEMSYFYSGYGLILCSIGDIDTGYKFGELGLALIEKLNARKQAARTQFMANCFIKHWKDPARGTLDGFMPGISYGPGDRRFGIRRSPHHGVRLYLLLGEQ